jgi:hypothetical protein
LLQHQHFNIESHAQTSRPNRGSFLTLVILLTPKAISSKVTSMNIYEHQETTDVNVLRLYSLAARERAIAAFDAILDCMFDRRRQASLETWQQLDQAETEYIAHSIAIGAAAGKVVCRQEILASIYAV